jgi:hypothetical protein
MTDTTFAEALRHSTMLVTLTTNTWGIHRTQRDLSDTIAAETQGSSRAFAVRKNLLSGADTYQRELVAAIAGFRTFLYRKTLPFASSGTLAERGPRIVANLDFAEIQNQLGITRARLETLLDQFSGVYDAAIDTAQRNLGSAFDADDYPPFDDVRDSFRVDIEFQPLPARGAFGSSLDAAITQSLDDEIEERQMLKARTAIADMRERATELATRYRDRADAAALHDPAGEARRPRITTSLFESATEVAKAITAFAPLAMLDPGLNGISSALYRLGTFDVDDLYASPATVRAALDALDQALRA